METERIDNAPAILPLMLWPGASPVYVPRELLEDSAALIQGDRALMYEPTEPDVRRVLDLGAGCGVFAVYCRLRWPQAWVDCVEPNPHLAALCSFNVPAGTRVLQETPGDLYDLVRVGDGDTDVLDIIESVETKIVFWDGVHAPRMPDSFVLSAQGMIRKGVPFSWWVRKMVRS